MSDPMLLLRPSRLPREIRGFEYVRELVRRNSAIVLDESKDYLIEARLAPIAEKEGLRSVDALISALSSQNPGKLHGRVVEALTTNETHFFRDIHPFRILGKEVLPKVMERNAETKTLRVWSAACSTGQEAYSIAMTLMNHCPALSQWDVNIHCTDLNETVLQTAEAGIYRQLEMNRGLPARDMIKHFDRLGTTWQVKAPLRDLCTFEKVNLAKRLPQRARYDIVFLRNVLIYFDAESKTGVLNRIAQAMNPGGFLFLGAAETTVNLTEKFTRACEGPGGCYHLVEGN